MLISTLIGIVGIADIIYLIKTLKKYYKLENLLIRLANQKYMNVQDVIKLFTGANQLPNQKIPVIVKGWIKSKVKDKDIVLSAVTSIPIFESDRLRQYMFQKIPYRNILAKSTSIQPKKLSNVSFYLQDLDSAARISVQSLQNSDISGALSQLKTFQIMNKSGDAIVKKLKKFFNSVMLLSPFKFSIKLGEKIRYYTLMDNHFTYIVGEASKNQSGQIQIKNPIYLTKQISFIVSRIKQSMKAHKYMLILYLIGQLLILFYAGKWFYEKYGERLKFLHKSQDQDGQQNVPFEQACIICYTSARAVIFKPCKHYGVCYSCYKRIGREKICPVCKEYIEGIIQVIKK